MKPKDVFREVKQVIEPSISTQARLFGDDQVPQPFSLSRLAPISLDSIRLAFPSQPEWFQAIVRIEKDVALRRRTQNGFIKKLISAISGFGKSPEEFFAASSRQMSNWKQIACRFAATSLPPGSPDALVICPYRNERPDYETERFIFCHEKNTDPIGDSFIEFFHLWPSRGPCEYKAWISPDGIHQYLIDQD